MKLQDTQKGFLQWWFDKHKPYEDFQNHCDTIANILTDGSYCDNEKRMLNNLRGKYESRYLAYTNIKVAAKNMKSVEPPRTYQGEIIALGKGLEKYEARIYDINCKALIHTKRFMTWEDADNWIDINTI